MSADRPAEPPLPGTGPTAEPPAQQPHDPAGGELARAVARAYRGMRGRTPAAPRRTGWRGKPRQGEPTVSGARPDDRDPQLLDVAMSRLVTEHGWRTEVAVHGLFGRWDTIIGREVAAHCRPERFVDGRLTVRADSTSWATQVRLLAPMVLQRLNDELGDGTVSRIEVAGPQRPSWRHGRFAIRDGRGPRDTYG